MNSKKFISLIIIISIIISFCSCGKDDNDSQMYLSGRLDIGEEAFGPAFVAVSISDDIEEIKRSPQEYMIMFSTADPYDHSFFIDLAETYLIPGEEIFIFAFADNDYDNGIPNPTPGDYIGFYFDSENWKTSYILNPGMNAEINFNVNRRVYDFDSEISGTVNGSYAGDVILIAYAGELNSLNFNDFDIDDIVGFNKLTKGETPLPFVLGIMPYGYDVPIQNVFIMALLDKNKNGKPDAGDIIGFHAEDAGNLPALITIDDGLCENKHIDLLMEIAPPSGYDQPLRGSMELPQGEIYDKNSKPLYLIIANTDDPNSIINDPLSSIEYFEKIKSPEAGAHIIEFNVDLSGTVLNADNEIFITALWDKDHTAGFPNPTVGDYIGFYIDSDAYSLTYRLKNSENRDIRFKVNRKIYSFNSEIQGNISGDETGEATIIAYTGDINSLNLKNALDFDAVIGYQKVTKNASSLFYSINILPYGFDIPIENVYIIAMLDKNGNNRPDAGDIIGFHTVEPNNLPSVITVNKGIITNKNIDLTMEIAEPSGYDKPVKGSIEMPEGFVYNENSQPLYLIFLNTDDPNTIFDDPIGTIQYFERVKPPAGGSHNIEFNIDLSQTALKAGDDIFITALLDNDFISGFPFPTMGDYIGFYIDPDAMSPTYRLRDDNNMEIRFNAGRRIYSFDSEVKGAITGEGIGEVTVIAYAGVINSLDIKNALDFDDVIGYQKISKGANIQDYTLKILPYGKNVPIQDVFLIAFLDKNTNKIPDQGDMIGFYSGESDNNLPGTIVIKEGATDDKNIDLTMEIAKPSGYNIPLIGSFDMPMGEVYNKNSDPVYLIIANTDDPNRIFDDPIKTIKYFNKIEPTEEGLNTINFNIDLSGTDLKAGDDIFIMAIQEKDLKAGFPYPTEGDYIGFYMDTNAFSPIYKLRDTSNDNIHFNIARKVYDFDAGVKGRVLGDDTGEMTIAAYAGDIHSLDFKNSLDFDAIIGYQKITINASNRDYSFKALPYGKNVPIENVYIIGFIDKNNNGKPDGGDKIGFYLDEKIYSDTGMQTPCPITIEEGTVDNIDITMLFDLQEPSGYNISIKGSFEKPTGYDENSPPIFLIVAQSDDIAVMFNDPLSAIKFFYKMPPGSNTFDLDLSSTDVIPGSIDNLKDDVVIIALWDRDFKGGFPDLTPGDYAGYLQNKNTLSYSLNLHDGENTIPSNGYELKLNKKIYQHNSSITFWLSKGLLPWGLNNDDNVMIVAIHKDGVNYLDMEMDMDYILANMSITAEYGEENKFNLKIFPIIYEGITVKEPFAIDDILIFAVHDGNRNERPDDGERIGFYWFVTYLPVPGYWPNTWDLTDGVNHLDRSVRFSELFTL